MSFVTTQPELPAAAAGDLIAIGSAMNAQNVALRRPPQQGCFPQQPTAIHEMFVNTLGTSAGSYAATEPANAVAAS